MGISQKSLYTVCSIILIAATSSGWYSSAAALPELNLALNLNGLNSLKNYYGPIIESKFIQNNTNLNVSISQVKKFGLLKIKLNVTNVTLDNLVINWPAITILPGTAANTLAISASDISAAISLHLYVKAGFLKINQPTTITVSGIQFNAIVAFSNNTDLNSLGVSVQITKLDLTYEKLSVKLKSKLLNFLVKRFLFIVKKQIPKILKKVQTQVNDQLKTLCAKPISQTFALPNTTTNFTATVNFPQGIIVQGGSVNELYLPVNIANIKNDNTGVNVPNFLQVPLPYQYFQGLQDVQAIVGESTVQQLIWTALQSGIVSIWMDNTDPIFASGKLPIALNTSSIDILLPGISLKYGRNKGMYLNITAGSTYPNFYIRAGRLEGSVSVLINFLVDMSSNPYPQPENNCQNCQSAITINCTLFVAADAWSFYNTTSQQTNIAAQVSDVTLISAPPIGKANVLYSQTVFSTIVNNLVLLTIPTINPDLANGFAIPGLDQVPLIGNLTLLLTNDYLVFSADILNSAT